MRGIQLYHVKGNGWNDIGYNFLVDRFGKVFEGRYGGIERNVVGAHAEGFNTGSVGVAVLGEYSSLAVAAKAREALARVLAWRLDLAHVDPASTLSFVSGGNARFAPGLPVFLRAVSGHRDTGFTDCPGTALYGLLTGIAGDVAQDRPAEALRARRDRRRPRERCASARGCRRRCLDGRRRRRGGTRSPRRAGIGTKVDWTWDATRLPPGRYSYAIRSDASVTPAVGQIGGGDRRARGLRPRG